MANEYRSKYDESRVENEVRRSTPSSVFLFSLVSGVILVLMLIRNTTTEKIVVDSVVSSFKDVELSPEMGIRQRIDGNRQETKAILKVIQQSETYLREWLSNPENEKRQDICTNKDELCSFWASEGFCDESYYYMIDHCSLACRLCDEVEEKKPVESYSQGLRVGVEQTVDGDDEQIERIQKVINFTERYYFHKLMTDTIDDECANRHELCSFWAAYDECNIHYKYMETNCKLACLACDMEEDSMFNTNSFGEVQSIGGDDQEIKATIKVIQRYETYLREWLSKPENEKLQNKCTNKDKLCSFWASMGSCDESYYYMIDHCPLACRLCDELKNETVEYYSQGLRLGVTQMIGGNENQIKRIQDVINFTERYYFHKLMTNLDLKSVMDECVNRNELCSFWAIDGECDKDHEFMSSLCPLACLTCDSNNLVALKSGSHSMNNSEMLGHVTKKRERVKIFEIPSMWVCSQPVMPSKST